MAVAHYLDALSWQRQVAELLEACAERVRLSDGRVVISHLYTERRLRPLDVYLREAGPDGAREAVIDYGQAMRDLAATNVFPGDMLLKNFGVTRHERVVFYDYDEIQPITDVTFRRIPPASSYEEELAAEPYWRIGETDIFPEQFDCFLVSNSRAREIFYDYHRDLLDPDFWATTQARFRDGVLEDVFPYPVEIRFPRASPRRD